MNLKFRDKRISGLLAILPAQEIRFEDEIGNYNFSSAKSMKLKMVMGYDKRRVVEEGTCVSDLCVFGVQHLLDKGVLKKEDIDALILVTQSPDHFMPPTSNIIQGKLGLKQDMICLDINQGCAGFIIGLIEAFLLLEQESIQKVVLLNADVLSLKVSKQDRNSNPLIGDGASVTVIEKTAPGQATIYGNIKMDGTGADALMIPAGGFRLPSSPETAILTEDANGNLRSKDHLVMRGDEVFNFVQTEVPPMIASLLESAGTTKEEVDYYMFHQPNKFMLQKLADKIGIAHQKMPNDVVENYGNSSGVTIPIVTAHTLRDRLLRENFNICFSGFGVGLTWSSLLMNIGNLDFSEIIEY